MTGPIVIVGRPRSGSRVLTELLLANRVFMGADLYSGSLDSASWYQRFVVPIMTSRFFPLWESCPSSRGPLSFFEERLFDTWPRYWKQQQVVTAAWGWKYCETLFVIPIVKRLLPGARFIHIIRDVRDVCLSNRGFFQLTQGQVPRDWDPASNGDAYPSFHDFCIAATFGQTGVRRWRGLDLASPHTLVDNRYLIQAQSWITCVTRTRTYSHDLAGDYYEIHYESLCLDPVGEAQKLFRWLNLPLYNQPEVRTDRVQKWDGTRMSIREKRDFDNALELAAPLLETLGYEL